MCYSSRTDFFSKDQPTYNNPNGKNHKKIIAKRRETWLKGEILHRAIMDISTKGNSSDPP